MTKGECRKFLDAALQSGSQGISPKHLFACIMGEN